MPPPVDYTGQKFGRLTAIGCCEDRNKFGFRLWRWSCDCGNKIDRPSAPIIEGRQVSCGCQKIEKAKARATHGMHATRTYRAWAAMKQRVLGSDERNNEFYADRGILIYPPWIDSFEKFFADVGECPKGKSLDRYPNNDGNYEPGNVRWATQKQQVSNTRRTVWVSVGGAKMCLKDACAIKGVNYDRTRSRIRAGIEPQAALDAP